MAKQGTTQVWLGARKRGYLVEGEAGRRKWSVRPPFQVDQEVVRIAPDPRNKGIHSVPVDAAATGR